ncbi:MAG: response regulator [Patescibacteria group bacterium]
MPKILFVEDDPFIAEIYKKKFESSQFDVLNVTSGRAVLRELKENTFDLVLLDLVIPEMSGMEVLEELRKNDEYPKDIKVIVFSNLSSTEDREQCLKLGANGFISKTEFSPSEVVDEVNRFLRQFGEQEKNLARAGAPAAETIEGQPSGKKRILIIEDEAVFVEMFSRRLRDEGYDVTSRPEGITGLQEAMDGNYDLIISDIMMPGMQGHEVIAKLRESEQGKNVPVIILSASVEDDHFQELSDAGIANKVFMKTEITPSELTYHVNDLLKDKA